MNVLFITLLDIRSASDRNLYADLIRQFAQQHQVYIVSPVERRCGLRSHVIEDAANPNVHILKLRTGNIQKTNLIEKGISTLLLEHQLQWGIRGHFSEVKFDLVLYSTPPITVAKPVSYIKKRDGATTYLLLKDIFPQNAVDLGMMSKTGIKSLIYKMFRRKEQRLYRLSDRIGCMSQANVDYLLAHNCWIDPAKVEVCPNSIEPVDVSVSAAERDQMRKKYGLPTDKKVFVYGGNLGRPQAIPFIIDCLASQANREDAFFFIVGDGTEYGRLRAFCDREKLANVKLMAGIPKEDYDRMIAACDVGLIFLDHRFTIPNFPSRLLSYMQAGLPVICSTDPNTDIGTVVSEGGFGWACPSDDAAEFGRAVDAALAADLPAMGEKSRAYLCQHYTAARSYQIICKD